MAGIVTHMAKTSGHDDFPPTNVIATSSTVFVNGEKVVLHGDKIIPHTNPDGKTHDGTVIASTSKVFIEGKPAASIGDMITCGDTIAESSSNVFIS